MKFYTAKIKGTRSNSTVYVALNLFSISHYKNLLLPHEDKIVFWCDGLFSKMLVKDAYKVPGTHFLRCYLQKPRNKLLVIGNLDTKEKQYLYDRGIDKIIHHKFVKVNREAIDQVMLKNGDIVLLNLPSPLQEKTAFQLAEKSMGCTFYCTGGALKMLTYPKFEAPQMLRRLHLEWIYRLRTDTLRRLLRLSRCVYYLLVDHKFISQIGLNEVAEYQ